MISIFLKKQIYNFDHTFKSNSLMYWDRIRKLIFKFNSIQFNSLALQKESSLHPPFKLLYRCVAATDLLFGLGTQPLAAT